MARQGSVTDTRRPGEVGEFTVLKTQPGSERALELLRKIHSLVKPIMKKHGWYLPVLSEFFPKNPNLLGINCGGGAKICIRLRPADDPHSFLPLEESLIGTILHELTHNHRGPHDDIFFKFLDGLQDEYDALRSSGYSGEGFLGSGHRVGEGVSHDKGVSLREAREKALRRFEERERVRRVLGTGGRLGGKAPETKGKRRGDILAEAAERRQRANKICGGDDTHDHPSGSRKEDLPLDVQRDIDAAERDSRHVVVDLTALSDEEEEEEEELEVLEAAGPSRGGKVKKEPGAEEAAGKGVKRGRSTSSSSPELEIVQPKRSNSNARPPAKPVAFASAASSSRPSSSAARPSSSVASPSLTTTVSTSSSRLARPTSTPSPLGSWTCPTCTYLNASPLSLACEMCLTERPAGTLVAGVEVALGDSQEQGWEKRVPVVVQDGWACPACTVKNEHTFWTCKVCGTLKRSSERG
ncbi:hypothetical protein JCM10207_004447 [Rhodosporidiobolus poonsookiae]